LGSALCESLHNVNNKYCPKGEKYTNTIYETRKNLVLLDWNNRKQKIPAIKWKKTDSSIYYFSAFFSEPLYV
jgi:hypothetical protein